MDSQSKANNISTMKDSLLNNNLDTAITNESRYRLTPSQITSISGATAGFLSGILVCPLDVAKTRLQAQGSFLKKLPSLQDQLLFDKIKYQGLRNTLTTIVKEEGTRGLYRGVIPITLGYFPTWMIYFTCYEKSKAFYSSFIKDDNISYFISAITSGAVSTTMTNPIWVVKTRLMLQMDNGKSIYDRFTSHQAMSDNSKSIIEDHYKKPDFYRGTLDAFRTMYKHEGISCFYRGLTPSYLGLVHVAIQFPLYENLKKLLHLTPSSSANETSSSDSNKLILFKFMIASSFSKMAASCITYPHEILRTRMQIKNRGAKIGPESTNGLVSTFLSIYRNEGVRGFYSGFVINLARTVPASAFTLVSFEYIKRSLEIANGYV